MSPNLYPSQEQYPQPEEEQQIESGEQEQLEEETGIESEPAQKVERTPAQETDYGRATAPIPVTRATDPQPLGDVKSPELIQIEQILAEHIDVLFQSLPDAQKPLFKEKGEEAAQKIDIILRSAKVKARQILSIIISWLSIIPGINKFFIEQQAEIKTNKLLALHDKQRRV